MKHEKEFTDDTIARQTAIAAEGLRRHRAIGNAPAPTPPENIESIMAGINQRAEEAAKRAEDGILNWAGGDRVVTPTPGVAPFPAEVVGVGTTSQSSTATTPRDFGHSLTSAPDGRGGCMSFEEIMRHGGH